MEVAAEEEYPGWIPASRGLYDVWVWGSIVREVSLLSLLSLGVGVGVIVFLCFCCGGGCGCDIVCLRRYGVVFIVVRLLTLERFNWAARKVHRRLQQLGANEFYGRGEGDEQHDEG